MFKKGGKMENLEINVHKIYDLENAGSVKALVDIAVNDSFVIKGFKIIDGKNGLFVGLPQRLGKNGTWYNNLEVLSSELKERISNVVLQAYETR